jgi:CRP-like cAMP-binding protein
MESRTCEAGEVIFRQGAAGQREAYLVHDGKVEVRRRTPEGKRLLRTLAIGDLLGEVALFGDGPHSATALAVERVTLLVVPADRLEHIVRTKPNPAIAIIRQLARMAAEEDNRASNTSLGTGSSLRARASCRHPLAAGRNIANVSPKSTWSRFHELIHPSRRLDRRGESQMI